MNDDLVTWIRAQLDEDEREATWAAEEVGDGHWQQRHVRIVTVADRDREVADYAIVECIDHIVRHDPARVLREVEAKRRILDWLKDDAAFDLSATEVQAMPRDEWYQVRLARTTIKLMALPYADRPGYREEWRP